jgi:putative DNA primase/helicase
VWQTNHSNEEGPGDTGPFSWRDNRDEATPTPVRIPDVTITSAHRELLIGSAITESVIDASGIESTGAGLRFPWCDGVGPVVWQTRPDAPRIEVDDKGRERPVKYEFPKGAKVPFHRLRDGDDYRRLILAEGTKQRHAVLSYAPADFAVYGMSGCWGFRHADLTIAEGRDVFLLLDADLDTNVDVWAAAEELTKKLKRHGAKSVAYVHTTGAGKEGVDDVLAGMPEAKRAPAMRLWLSQAETKLPRRPRAKAPQLNDIDGEAIKLFRKVEGRMMFQPMDAAERMLSEAPAAITAERNIAVYRNGVYAVDSDAVLSNAVNMLGNFYTPGHLKTMSDTLIGRLYAEGRLLPERMDDPLLNCANVMVNLRTGQSLPHSPDYLSHIQVAVDYDPNMPTPIYDAWLAEALRQDDHSDDDVAALVRDIEETAGTMLDPSRTPSKALFLFGPSRSAKSTFLRLMKAVSGAANTSAVTLQEFGTDQFATANLYGKMLNVAADLSNSHVSDLSKFKMITGEDLLHANRKYGKQFSFTNQALVAFSANELPTVSEASRAYAERMKPFHFPNSFAGREDKTLEPKLMAELPGILARWVRAYGRFLARGGYCETDAATQTLFEAKSDRVVQFFQDMVTMTEASHGDRLPVEAATGRRDVAVAFNAWAERNGGTKMGERAFFQRFAQIAGVAEVRVGAKGQRAFNVTVARADDDLWHEDIEPVADPIPASGTVTEGSPWDAPEGLPAPCPVPAAVKAPTAPQTVTEAVDPFGDGLGLKYDF